MDCYNGLKSAHRETGTEWHIRACFVSWLCFNEWNISMMNKYSHMCSVAVRSLVHKAQQTVCQVCSLDYIFLCKIFYTPSLLQILHMLIPSNTWYHRWSTQYIADIRRHTISAHLPNSYKCLHNLPITNSLPNPEHWCLLKVLTFIF